MRGFVALLTLVSACGTVRVARGAEPFDSALARAVQAKEQALDGPTEEQWQRAYEAFLVADGFGHSAETQYELGVAASNLEQIDLAAEYFSEALRLGLTDPALGKAQSYLLEHRARLATVNVHGKSGTVVRVRGVPRGRLPLARPLQVVAGQATLELVDAESSRSRSYELDLKPGEQQTLNYADSARDSEPDAQPALVLTVPAAVEASHEGLLPTRIGWGVLASGAGMVLSSAVAFGISQYKLSEQRTQLRSVCAGSLVESSNGCAHTTEGKYEAGLELADGIARWRTVRALSLVGLGVGAISASVGVLAVYRRPPRRQGDHAWSGTVDLSPRHIQISLHQAF